MYLGKVVESGPVDEVFSDPLHPYASADELGSAVDHPPKTKLEAIGGSVPEPYDLPKGCSFWPRCPKQPMSVWSAALISWKSLIRSDGSDVIY